ncbi:MAG: efflux RND transporter permease subunit [Steroidobacteraceae bacterium]
MQRITSICRGSPRTGNAALPRPDGQRVRDPRRHGGCGHRGARWPRVRLQDVATVERGYRDRDSITRLDGGESIELAVYREGNANTVQLARRVAARLDALRASRRQAPDSKWCRTSRRSSAPRSRRCAMPPSGAGC